MFSKLEWESGVHRVQRAVCSAGCRVFSKLKWESGVHRVQRVPATETSGRVHTSTATVAVMPEVDDVDVKLDPKVRHLARYVCHFRQAHRASLASSPVSFSLKVHWFPYLPPT